MCCMSMDAGCESCRQGMTLADFCMVNPDWMYGGCPSTQMCCMSMDAGCESCRQGMTLDDFCMVNPGWLYGGCPSTQMCCMGMEATCESCRQGMTLDDFCMFNPGWSYGGCPTTGRRRGKRPNRRPGNQICCMSMGAGCESCRQGMTLDDFCLANPGWEYGGCPEEEPLACCKALTASCLACGA